MKPNFALTLSHGGLSLLHRSRRGEWTPVGDVAFAVPDLAGQLVVLRRTAVGLAGKGFASKLVIPNSEILYIKVHAPGPSHNERRQQVEAALEGQTPYSVDELVLDWTGDGANILVAAVARETLQEAEAFAAEHRFNPVSFVAMPEAGDFNGEPFFGPTTHAARLLGAAHEVERDLDAMKIGRPMAPRDIAKAAAAAEAPPESSPATAPQPARKKGTTAKAPKPAQGAKAAKPTKKAKPGTAAAPDTPTKAAPAKAAPAEPDAPRSSFAFASRRKHRAAPQSPAVTTPEGKAASAPQAAPDGAPQTAAESAPPAKRRAWKSRITALAPRKRRSRKPSPRKAAARKTAAASTPESAPTPAPKTTPIAAAAPAREPVNDIRSAAPPTPRLSRKDEALAMTVFGARGRPEPQVRIGLIVTIILLLALVAVAIWSAIFMPDNAVARLLGLAHEPATVVSTPTAPASPDETRSAAIREPDAIIAAPSTTAPADGDIAPGESPPEAAQATAPTQDIATLKPPETFETAEDIYIATADRAILPEDPVILPDYTSGPGDARLPMPLSPAPPGTKFAFDARGLVIATPDGALTPDGVRVLAGRPIPAPPERPKAIAAAGSTAPEAATNSEAQTRMAMRPLGRPGGLPERTERARHGGRTLEQLAALRPQRRPERPAATTGPDAAAEPPATGDTTAATPEPAPRAHDTATLPPDVGSQRAVRVSLIPRARPDDFAATVGKIEADAVSTATASATATARTAPILPTSASVARRATDENAIRLNQVNLIGVYGTPENRRALVRMPNGRYVKVEVGDRMDGGKVAAIDADALRYIKRGRNITLTLPRDG